MLVLSRHAGEGDSLLVLHELPSVTGGAARGAAPGAAPGALIDILGHRLPNRFVDPRGGDIEEEIAAMARDLGDEDALLIFPEGGNFTPTRRRRAIERLVRGGHCEEAAWAREMRHVSAPRPGGTLAAMRRAARRSRLHRPRGAGRHRGLWRSMPGSASRGMGIEQRADPKGTRSDELLGGAETTRSTTAARDAAR